VRLQLQIVRADRGYLNEIIANPFFAIIFLGVVRASGRTDLTSFALVAPVLMTLWAMALEISGNVVDSDRALGILEEVVATPTPFGTVVFGRVLTVTMLSTVAVAETWLVARLGFGVHVTIEHPEVFVAALLVTGLAMTGTALVMAGAFVLAGGARTFQNTMNYPIYLLAGVLVPISFLPEWLRPVSRLIFLSWSADLLRDSLQAAPATDVMLRLGAVAALGAVGFAVGIVVLHVVLRRVRDLGTLSHT
jgi:ABC-2 type transport system permease protein